MSFRSVAFFAATAALCACSGSGSQIFSPVGTGSAVTPSSQQVLTFATPSETKAMKSRLRGMIASIASTAVTYSALRVPGATTASARSRDALGTVAYPVSALAYPVSALAYPISALAYAGQPAPTTFSGCTNANSRASGCRYQINTAIALNPTPLAPTSQISGIQPALLRALYNMPGSGGSGQVVGVVVAYDNPSAEADMAIYRATFGLPACTTANGCFEKINQTGSTAVRPATDANWSIESSLDLDAVSAICPSCKIVLAEANTNNIPDLAATVDSVVGAGATVVSNSYGVPEASDNVQYASHYEHSNIPMTAAAGDVGYGPQFPATVPSVTAVGGTSVQQINASGAIQEVVWPGTGSGCSAFFAKPSYQNDSGCGMRAANDIGFMADPNDGIAVYDSTLPNTASGGWTVISGTSLGAPAIAALIALEASNGMIASNASIYANASANRNALVKVTTGSNGTCAVAYLCTGAAGYSGPAGVGVPFGSAALRPGSGAYNQNVAQPSGDGNSQGG